MLDTLLGRRYRVVAVLGSGGYGQTFVAEDTQRPGSPKCVVKHLKPSSQNPTFLQVARRLFAREAETLEKLGRHDQIPQLLAYFEDNQEFYLVQELIEGHALSDELRPGVQLSQSEVIALLQDVLEILEFVHANQVIHRDIKPSNLIRRHRDSKLVLIDFGAVKQIQAQPVEELDQTDSTVAIGTPGYMPNEQLGGRPQFNSDLYALGMVAIQALTGIRPTKLDNDPETSEILWRNRTHQVNNQLAAILDKMVRYHPRERYQSATEALQALQQLTDPAVEPIVPPVGVAQTRLRRIWKIVTGTGLGIVTIASLINTGLVAGVRQLGTLQGLELNAFDQMIRLRQEQGLDKRLLVVEVTEQDIQSLKQYPLYDGTVARLLEKLEQYQPRVIGLDILRDVPQQVGRTALLQQLKQSDRIIAVCKLSDTENPGVPVAPGIPETRVGFADFLQDSDGKIRRSLLVSVPKTSKIPVPNKHLCNDPAPDNQVLSLGFQLALVYLQAQGISPAPTPAGDIKLGSTVFKRLEKDAGGYQNADVKDFQILLNYRPNNTVQRVTLTDVLEDKIKPKQVKDRVVLIGYTSQIARDYFLTPYSSGQQENQKMPGVVVHAQSVSQILSAVLEKRRLLWYLPKWVEGLWIGGWAIIGGIVVWRSRHPLVLSLNATATLGILFGTCFGLFTQQALWIPVAAPALASVLTGGLVLTYRAYQMKYHSSPVTNRPISTSTGVRPQSVAEVADYTIKYEIGNLDFREAETNATATTAVANFDSASRGTTVNIDDDQNSHSK